MSAVASLSLIVTGAVSAWTVVSLYRSSRLVASALVLTAAVLLLLFGFSITASTRGAFYYLHALIFLCLFLTLYPAIRKNVGRERVRMLSLFGCIALAVFFTYPILTGLGLPTPIIVAAFAVTAMLAYTIGTLATERQKSKIRQRSCGIRHAVWGAVAVSHLLLYPAIGIVFFLPAACENSVLTVVLCCVSLLLAELAALGIRSEGDYWGRLQKKPKSVAQSSRYLTAALVHTDRKRLL